MTIASAIGGYFGLELAGAGDHRHATAHRFQSARAAFLGLLDGGRPRRVWMPWYICDSMLEPLAMRGVLVERYGLNESFDVAGDIALESGDWLLYANYFGLHDGGVERVLARFAPDQVVIDNAQAFYSRARDCLATLYSPRKFFGVPDGGYLVTRREIAIPAREDEGSVHRCTHLLTRLAAGAEAGYATFQAAEQSLSRQEPLAMSRLTSALLGAIDYEGAARRRRENFLQLHAALGASNRLEIRLDADAVPLCYPYRSPAASLRERLRVKRVYAPTYWPEVNAAAGDTPRFERDLAASLVAVPCDQRYCGRDMARVIDVIGDRQTSR